jgi:hypothetical protein
MRPPGPNERVEGAVDRASSWALTNWPGDTARKPLLEPGVGLHLRAMRPLPRSRI